VVNPQGGVVVCEGVLLCPHASADTTANEWTGLHF
jgi:hypothetical protein